MLNLCKYLPQRTCSSSINWFLMKSNYGSQRIWQFQEKICSWKCFSIALEFPWKSSQFCMMINVQFICWNILQILLWKFKQCKDLLVSIKHNWKKHSIWIYHNISSSNQKCEDGMQTLDWMQTRHGDMV